jgi:hypothetical protein
MVKLRSSKPLSWVRFPHRLQKIIKNCASSFFYIFLGYGGIEKKKLYNFLKNNERGKIYFFKITRLTGPRVESTFVVFVLQHRREIPPAKNKKKLLVQFFLIFNFRIFKIKK